MIMETLGLMVFLPALAIGFIAVLFGLSRLLSLEGLGRMSSGLGSWRINLWQVMTAVVAVALVLMVMASSRAGEAMVPIILLSVWVLAWFVRNWRKEFVFLMGLGDEDFPGHHDKLIWAVVVVALAPVGVWFFRSYRLAHWPESKTVVHDEFGPEPAGNGAAVRPAWDGSSRAS